MSLTYISVEFRRIVAERAGWLCEYCLLSEDDTGFGCQVDHIISEKHGGPTSLDNLAYACVFCNQAKGSDIGSILWESGEHVQLFHPRQQRWSDHFQLVENRIEGLTPIGKVTTRLLQFNSRYRLLERETLRSVDRYPSIAALTRMQTSS